MHFSTFDPTCHSTLGLIALLGCKCGFGSAYWRTSLAAYYEADDVIFEMSDDSGGSIGSVFIYLFIFRRQHITINP